MSSRESSTNIKRGDMFLNDSNYDKSYYINVVLNDSTPGCPVTIFAMLYSKAGKLLYQGFETTHLPYLKKTMKKIK